MTVAIIMLVTLLIVWIVMYNLPNVREDKPKKSVFTIPCKHEWERIGGAGSNTDGNVYKCKKCGFVGMN